MSLFAELKRRNVVKVGLAYLVVAWLIAQVVGLVAPALYLPAWTVTLVVLLLMVGLPVALLLAWVYELTPEGVKRTMEVRAADSITHVTSQKLNYVIIGALALVLGVFVVDRFVLDNPAAPGNSATAPARSPSESAARDQAPGRAVHQVLPNSVAVLPFTNMSPRPDDGYFAAGIHEEVLNYLAKLSKVNVIARTSMLRYAATSMSLRDIAEELGVETIMEGSVRYAGDEVRITAQLINPQTGAHLWSEAYQRKFDDIFAIQADIAMNIANAVGAEFSAAEQTNIEKPLTSSADAYALYLQAATIIQTTGPTAMETAISLLDRATALDPEFGQAYSQKAYLYSGSLVNTTQGTAVAPEGREQLDRLVVENAERALAIDPADGRAKLALRIRDLLAWRWQGYVETLTPAEERALSIGSLWAVAWAGERARAVEIAERNAELNPNDVVTHMSVGIAQAYAGDYAASTRSLKRALQLGPAVSLARAWLAYNAIALGDRATALEELQLVERMNGETPALVYLPEFAYAFSRIGRPDDAQRYFAALEERAATTDVGVGTWAMAYLAIGNEPEALRQLELAAAKARNQEPDQGYIQLMNLRMNFLADPRLREPRFAEVLERIRGS